MPKRDNISMSVIRRLPRLLPFSVELKDNGVVRISSRELSDKMALPPLKFVRILIASAGSDSRAMDILWNSSITKSGNILGLSNRFNAY